MALELTQPLREMSTRIIYWGVTVVGPWGCQPYHLHVPTVLKSGNLNLLESSGPIQACSGIALPLLILEHMPCARNTLTGSRRVCTPHFLVFRTGAVDVFIPLSCGAASLDDWCTTFRDSNLIFQPISNHPTTYRHIPQTR